MHAEKNNTKPKSGQKTKGERLNWSPINEVKPLALKPLFEYRQILEASTSKVCAAGTTVNTHYLIP